MKRLDQHAKPIAPARLLTWVTAGSLAFAVLAGCGTPSSSPPQQQNGTGATGQGAMSQDGHMDQGMQQSAPASQDLRQMNWRVQPYQGKDQDGRPFDVESMKGKVWVADVIFTSCTMACPIMTPNMAQLQKKLAAANLSAELVSFSCDPETDTPGVLKQYADKYGADLKTWHFVTNGDFIKTKEFVEKTFHSTIEKQPPSTPGGMTMVIHSTRFFLINRNGQIVKMYDGMKPPFDEIIQDVKGLQ